MRDELRERILTGDLKIEWPKDDHLYTAMREAMKSSGGPYSGGGTPFPWADVTPFTTSPTDDLMRSPIRIEEVLSSRELETGFPEFGPSSFPFRLQVEMTPQYGHDPYRRGVPPLLFILAEKARGFHTLEDFIYNLPRLVSSLFSQSEALISIRSYFILYGEFLYERVPKIFVSEFLPIDLREIFNEGRSEVTYYSAHAALGELIWRCVIGLEDSKARGRGATLAYLPRLLTEGAYAATHSGRFRRSLIEFIESALENAGLFILTDRDKHFYATLGAFTTAKITSPGY